MTGMSAAYRKSVGSKESVRKAELGAARNASIIFVKEHEEKRRLLCKKILTCFRNRSSLPMRFGKLHFLVFFTIWYAFGISTKNNGEILVKFSDFTGILFNLQLHGAKKTVIM